MDHHSVDDDKVAPAAEAASERPGARGPGDDAARLVDLAWRQQCVTCHGPTGRGDGQMGPMVKAPDLTREDWQAHVTDAEIETTIQSGKNRMPKFDLPLPVLEGLVARIRSLRAGR